jgi:hypothetical protein
MNNRSLQLNLIVNNLNGLFQDRQICQNKFRIQTI